MQYKLTTGWLIALALHLFLASALHVPRSDLSSTNDSAPPYIEQFDFIDHFSLVENTSVQLGNNTCTPYSPNTSHDLYFGSGSQEDGGLLNVQFDVFRDANCSQSSLLETLWQEGSHLTKIKNMYDLRSRLLSMKSVRVRYGMTDAKLGDPTSVAGWNNTAVICPDEGTFLCYSRDGTPDGSTIKRDLAHFAPGYPPMVGQFTSDDCSGPMSEDNDTAQPVNGRVIQAAPNIIRGGDCIAWYPILDEQHGPSVGIQFGQEERVQQVDFFKSNPRCEADEKTSSLEGDIAASSCCDKSAGGFLGTMAAGLTPSDFGVKRNVTLEGNWTICAQIGEGKNPALWETRYFNATLVAKYSRLAVTE